MILRPPLLTPRVLRILSPQLASRRPFSSSSAQSAQNRIFSNIRTPDELHTLTFASLTDNRPLITLWTAGWCQTCQQIKPLVRGLIEDGRVGEKGVSGEDLGGLGYAEVEIDSTLIGDLPVRYMITSMPTLLAFSRQEAQLETKLTRPEQMKDKEFLREWLLNEARRGGRKGGSGGSLFGGLYGNLFGGR